MYLWKMFLTHYPTSIIIVKLEDFNMSSAKILREYIELILSEAIKKSTIPGELTKILNLALQKANEKIVKEKLKNDDQKIDIVKNELMNALGSMSGLKKISDSTDMNFKDQLESLGSSRIVYASENFVIKIPINKAGLSQNVAESNVPENELLTRMLAKDEIGINGKPAWVAFERVYPMTKEKFKEIFGMDHEVFSNAVCDIVLLKRDGKNVNIEALLFKKLKLGEKLPEGPRKRSKAERIALRWIQFFMDPKKGENLSCGDTMKLESLGFSKITNNVVTFDYGLTRAMQDELRRERQTSEADPKTKPGRRAVMPAKPVGSEENPKPEIKTSAERPRAK